MEELFGQVGVGLSDSWMMLWGNIMNSLFHTENVIRFSKQSLMNN
ncbi:hypothetical protein [Priestia filamentosa]